MRIVLALVVLAGASYIFIAGDSGLMELAQRREELRRLEQSVADLVAENDSLKRVLSLLDSDSSFVERVAREKYEMVKPGEAEEQPEDRCPDRSPRPGLSSCALDVWARPASS